MTFLRVQAPTILRVHYYTYLDNTGTERDMVITKIVKFQLRVWSGWVEFLHF